MVDMTIEREVHACLEQLSVAQQRQVLEIVRILAQPQIHGVPGTSLLQFAGTIDDADLDTMTQAIEDGCERIDANEW